MKLSRGIVYILVALVLGLMGTFVIHAYVTPSNLSTVQKMVPVVVAGANINPGTALRPEFLRVVQWPQEILPPHTANMVQQVEGMVVTVPVTKGEPILLPKLAPIANQRHDLNKKKLSNITLSAAHSN